jgi:hypothetical protein
MLTQTGQITTVEFHSNNATIGLLEDIKDMFEEDFSLFLKEEPERLHEMNWHDYLQRLATLADTDKLLMADTQLMRIFPGQYDTNLRSYAKNFIDPGRYYAMSSGSRVFTNDSGAQDGRIMTA